MTTPRLDMSESELLVTVIVPTYNRAHTLDRALNSIVNQSCRNLEVLVVDDHSDDKTHELVLGYEANDPRVRYLQNPGLQGPSAARNVGLRQARGNYIAFLESDDEWDLEHVSRSVALLLNTQVDIVFSDVLKVRDGKPSTALTRKGQMRDCGLQAAPGLQRSYTISNTSALLGFFIDCEPLVYLTTVVYDHRILTREFNEAHRIAEDLEFYIHLIIDDGASFGFVDATGTTKHESTDSMSRWMEFDRKRYYSSQLDTYRSLIDSTYGRLDASRAARLALRAGIQADRLGGCFRRQGDGLRARRLHVEAFRTIPASHPAARVKQLAKILRTFLS